MYISKLNVVNFRNFRSQNFLFEPGVNTLIGESGSGKTNAFFALRLMLDDNLPISASKLIENDFNRELKKWKGHWIVISLHFKQLDSSEGANLLAHKLEHVTEPSSSGSYNFYYRPKKKYRKKLYELSLAEDKSLQKLDEILNEITINDYEAVYHFRGTADFSDDEVYKELVGDFENISFPNPDEENKELLGTPTSQIFLIRTELKCTYIKALRDVMTELRRTRQSPLLNLLRGSAKNILVEDSEQVADQVTALNKTISNLQEVNDLAKKVKRTLDSTVGYTFAPSVSIRSELPEDINKLFQSLTLWVGDGDDNGHQGKLDELSLGGANLIYITLKLLEYEYMQPLEEKAAHFLLIEEPEAHIHTHIQKTMFENYSFHNTQVITSTHSTHISSANRIRSINILCKEKRETIVCQPSKGLSIEECKKIERYLDATRSTLLFAKGVILVEGDAELILIPAIFKNVFGLSLDEIGVSVINVNSTVFEHISNLFHDERIKRKCAIITDHDKSLIPLDTDKSKDTEEMKKFRNSEKKGEERKIKLDNYCKENQWIEAFYAKNTFEIDFVLNGNVLEVVKTLSKIYKKPQAITDSKKLLRSKDDIKVGLETLRLADKVVGKGWFALMLAEEVTFETLVPRYILDAIVFASGHIGYKHFEKMFKHRMFYYCGEEEYEKFLELIEAVSEDDRTLDNLLELSAEYLEEDDDIFLFIDSYKGERLC
ncbi:ATP-dependent endonuclease [Bacillus sp. TE8-1]|uniref:ATP-dependent nuclease n=1 Tax=Bacillus sp. TE8-1 TaxID=2217829 RepID=UPI0011EBBD51|nr:AAA family ATPase [Bacillus sp. TE8-1]KAA0761723.1 ATP-dependent endonuclease [Bacillus sp. TE8-1]